MKAYSFPLLVLLAETGLALYATTSQTADQMSQNARLLRSMPDADIMHLELDSKGKSLKNALQPASLMEKFGTASKSGRTCSPGHDASGNGPTVDNGGFEIGSTTDDYQQFNPAWTNFTWSSLGDYPYVVKDNSVQYQNARSARGTNYFLALNTRDSGVTQCVPGHIQNQWYRAVFHAGYQTPTGGCAAAASSAQGSLKVMINARVKFNEPINCGSMVWYAVTYKALEADGNELLTFINSGPAGNSTAPVFIDEIYVEPVVMWDESGANAGNQRVLLQKVECTGYPEADTCQLGRFLSVGDETNAQLLDGRSTVDEDNAAHRNSVFWTIHEVAPQRWSFKSDKLDVQSTAPSVTVVRDTLWYLHADYATCEARNWKKQATSMFYVKTNGLGYHQISSAGTECGSLFAIQRFTPPDSSR